MSNTALPPKTLSSMVVLTPPRQEWLDRHKEEAIEPDLPIIDPHHHFFEAPRHLYQMEHLLADTRSGHNIAATMYAEAGTAHRVDGPEHLRSVGEVEYANGIAALSASGNYGPTRLCAGIVGSGALNVGVALAQEMLEALIRAGNGRLKGIRNTTIWDADPEVTVPNPKRPKGMMLTGAFRDGVALLAPLGLVLDNYTFFHQLGEMEDLARAFPNTSMVLDHVGGVIGVASYANRRDEVFKVWSAGIRNLARCPNVNVKVGGMGMPSFGFGFGFDGSPNPPTSEQLAATWKPYVDTVIGAFGPDRCMFESNFPPDKLAYSYGVGWNAFKRLAAGYSAKEKRELFAGTAARVYKLDVPGFK